MQGFSYLGGKKMGLTVLERETNGGHEYIGRVSCCRCCCKTFPLWHTLKIRQSPKAMFRNAKRFLKKQLWPLTFTSMTAFLKDRLTFKTHSSCLLSCPLHPKCIRCDEIKICHQNGPFLLKAVGFATGLCNAWRLQNWRRSAVWAKEKVLFLLIY